MTTPRKPKTAAPADTAPADVVVPDVEESAGAVPDAELEDGELEDAEHTELEVVHTVPRGRGLVAEYLRDGNGRTYRVVRRLTDDELEEQA